MNKINVVTLCSGYGAQELALERLKKEFPQFDYEVLAWSEIDPNACAAYKALHSEYSDRNIGDMTKADYSAIEGKVDLLFYSTPCFVAGTWIRTLNGLKQIECVKQGDYVLTHTNSYKKVVKTMVRNYQGVTYSLECPLFENLICTSNHPLYVRAKKKGHTSVRNFSKAQWLSPKEIMHELTKDPVHGIAQVRSYHIGYAINQKSELPKWNFPATTWKQQGNLVNSMLDKEDFWYVMGRYIGDGWKRINGKYGNCLIICCSPRNRDSLYGALERLGLHSHSVQERTVEKVFISRNELVAFVERFGYYAYGKRIDAETINLPIPLLKSFVDGVMDSDGHREGNWYHITSVSEELIYDLGQCVAKVYKRPFSIYKTKRPKTTVIEGRTVNQKDSWTIKWKITDNKQDRAFYDNGYIWSPIMKITWQQSRQPVYNMEVEEDNSYTANGAIVHNCQSVSTAGKQRGMKKGDDDAASALIWHTERAIRELKPKWCVLENVKGMVCKRNKHDFDEWCGVLESYGYTNFWQVLNAKDYGVPQHRERVFMVSILGDKATFEFPKPFPLEKRLRDVLEDNVPESYYLKDEQVAKILEHSERKQAQGCGFKYNFQDMDGIAGTICTAYGQRYTDTYLKTEPEIIQVGNYMDDTGRGFKNPQCGRVYSVEGISPTLNTCGGGDSEPKILIVGSYSPTSACNGKVLDANGICPTLLDHKGAEPAVIEVVSCAIHGYNKGGLFEDLTYSNIQRISQDNSFVIKKYCIRRLTEREFFRLMGMDDADIDKIDAYRIQKTLKNGKVKEKPISKSARYRCAGNSIVVNVLTHIFRCMFIPNQPEYNKRKEPKQLSLFD